MSETQETPVIEPGETATPEVGNEAPPSTPTPEEGKEKITPEASATAELEKKLKQAEMRANQLENKIRDEELARIKATEDDKARADRLEAELEKIEAEKQQGVERQAATDFRDKVIAEYPDAVKEAAKRLIEKNPSNLLWKDASDWDDAGTQLREQLDSLKEILVVDEDEEGKDPVSKPRVNANNPNPSGSLNGIDPATLSFDELRKVLPRSKRDY